MNVLKIPVVHIGLAFVSVLTQVHVDAQDRYAVLIGVESYNPAVLGPLQFAEDDAIALGTSLKELGYKTKTMTGQSRISTAKPSTPQKILRVLTTHMNNCAPGDTMVVSLSGHGLQFSDDVPDKDGVRETYFCPEDADPADRSSLLKISDVVELMRQCKASRKLMLIDACRNEFASTSGQRKAAKALKLTSVHEVRRSIPGGMTLLFSSGQDQYSYEHEDLGHSVFSYFVIRYLAGNAEDRFYENTKPHLDGLTSYVRKRTNEYVADNNLSAAGQTPIFSGISADWVLGDGASQARRLLQKHIDWIGGKGNIRAIQSLQSTGETSMKDSLGNQVTYVQHGFANESMVVTDTMLNGQTYNQGCSRELGWVTELDGTLRPMDELERKITFLGSHPLGWIEALENYSDFKVSGRAVVDGVDTTELILGNLDGEFFKINLDGEGQIRKSEIRLRGQTVLSRPNKFSTIGGHRFVVSAEIEIKNDTFQAKGITDTRYKLNPNIPASRFTIPANVPRNPVAVDMDKLVGEYITFQQEFVAKSEGTLSNVKFRKISSNTMAVDLFLAPGVLDNTTPEFWQVDRLKPYFIGENLEAEDRAVIRKGVVIQVTYKTPNGAMVGQFYITANDL